MSFVNALKSIVNINHIDPTLYSETSLIKIHFITSSCLVEDLLIDLYIQGSAEKFIG